MNPTYLHVGIKTVSVLISLLSFFLLIVIAIHYSPLTAIKKTYQNIHHSLKEKRNGIFDYEKMDTFLIKNGAIYHLSRRIEPIRFMALRLIVAALGIFIGSRYHILASFLIAVIGFQIPKFYLLYTNKKDNLRMLTDIKLIFHALAIQIRAGVYVTDALTECYGSVTNQRLRDALLDLSSEIILKSDTEEALERFQAKFNNSYIDSLCIIILQSLESGQAVDLLYDISEQIKDMEMAVMQRRKGQLDRITTLCLLGVMSVILGIVIYASVVQMFSAAVYF